MHVSRITGHEVRIVQIRAAFVHRVYGMSNSRSFIDCVPGLMRVYLDSLGT